LATPENRPKRERLTLDGNSVRHHRRPVTPKPQIMYIARIDSGPETRIQWARIARVKFSKTGRTLYYDGRVLRGHGQPWYEDTETRESFWIHPAPRRFKYPSSIPAEIDEDVRVEFWTTIREEPQRVHERIIRSND
jgi:hypothetical protein